MTYLFLAIIMGIITLDQVTKFLFEGKFFSLIGDFLWVFSTRNEGAAFSMFEGARWIFVGITIPILIILFFVVFHNKLNNEKFLKVGLSILIGGIIGNFIDRIILGYVRDFVYFKSIGFAIFNLADTALTVGCIMLVIWVLFLYKPDKKTKDVKKEKSRERIDL